MAGLGGQLGARGLGDQLRVRWGRGRGATHCNTWIEDRGHRIEQRREATRSSAWGRRGHIFPHHPHPGKFWVRMGPDGTGHLRPTPTAGSSWLSGGIAWWRAKQGMGHTCHPHHHLSKCRVGRSPGGTYYIYPHHHHPRKPRVRRGQYSMGQPWPIPTAGSSHLPKGFTR